MSGSASSSMRSPLRTTAWSSASTMVISLSDSATASGLCATADMCAQRTFPQRPHWLPRIRLARGAALLSDHEERIAHGRTGLGLLSGLVLALGVIVFAMALADALHVGRIRSARAQLAEAGGRPRLSALQPPVAPMSSDQSRSRSARLASPRMQPERWWGWSCYYAWTGRHGSHIRRSPQGGAANFAVSRGPQLIHL